MCSLYLQELAINHWASGELVKTDALITEVNVHRGKNKSYHPTVQFQANGKTITLKSDQKEIESCPGECSVGDVIPIYYHPHAPHRAYTKFNILALLGIFVFVGICVAAVVALVNEKKEQIEKKGIRINLLSFPAKPVILLYGSLFIILGCWILGNAYQLHSQRAVMEEQCTEKIQAKIIIVEEKPIMAIRKSSFATVGYNVNNKNYLTYLSEPCIDYCKPGQQLSIKINPNDPSEAIITYRTKREYIFLILAFSAILLGFFIIFISPVWTRSEKQKYNYKYNCNK